MDVGPRDKVLVSEFGVLSSLSGDPQRDLRFCPGFIIRLGEGKGHEVRGRTGTLVSRPSRNGSNPIASLSIPVSEGIRRSGMRASIRDRNTIGFITPLDHWL